MDVDGDIELDGKLMQQFLSMGTQDREVLVTEFQKLLGNQLNPAACSFFLDMNNWNLQAAIGSYYDYEQHNDIIPLPSMTFIKDVTIGEGESVRPAVNFIKTWRIKNSGTSTWPPGCSLKFIVGYQLGTTERRMVDALAPGAECDVSVPMTSPSAAGMYHGQWRMISPTGVSFGDTIWVILQVSDTGLLDITQEMSRFGMDHSDTGPKTAEHLGPSYNPFNSPHKDVVHSLPSTDASNSCTSTISPHSSHIGNGCTSMTTYTTTAIPAMSTISPLPYGLPVVESPEHTAPQSKEEEMQ